MHVRVSSDLSQTKQKISATVQARRKGVWGSQNIARPSCLGQSVLCFLSQTPESTYAEMHPADM